MFNDQTVFTFKGPWGIPIEIGRTLPLLVGLLIFMSLNSNLVGGIMFAVMLVLAIFLHELGHAWGCRVQGIPVRRIKLYGGGGFCQHARSTTRRESELIVIMGPLVNLALWALSGLLWPQLVDFARANAVMAEVTFYLYQFSLLNLFLFAMNMIPVQPLDGGKLFHLFLCRFLDPRKALRIAGGVGLVMAVLWIPAMIGMYIFAGFVLLFFPSIKAHYHMMRGDTVLHS